MLHFLTLVCFWESLTFSLSHWATSVTSDALFPIIYFTLSIDSTSWFLPKPYSSWLQDHSSKAQFFLIAFPQYWEWIRFEVCWNHTGHTFIFPLAIPLFSPPAHCIYLSASAICCEFRGVFLAECGYLPRSPGTFRKISATGS